MRGENSKEIQQIPDLPERSTLNLPSQTGKEGHEVADRVDYHERSYMRFYGFDFPQGEALV